MKVKLTKDVSILGTVRKRGTVVNLHSATAMNLVRSGKAERVVEKESAGPDKNKATEPAESKPKKSKKKSSKKK